MKKKGHKTVGQRLAAKARRFWKKLAAPCMCMASAKVQQFPELHAHVHPSRAVSMCIFTG